ncbi:MAG: DUF1178 family protein [Pseudomonadota bacterium]
MISANLSCAEGHQFDGWFKDNATLDAQLKAHKIICPICADTTISRRPNMPNIARAKGEQPPRAQNQQTSQQLQAYFRAKRAQIREHFDNVGDEFAKQAIQMHQGKVETRPIYGTADRQGVATMKELNVQFAPIPWLHEDETQH